MSKVTGGADIYWCDQPGCNEPRFTAKGEDPPDGFHGTVQQAFAGAVSGSRPWFACTADHIKGAVEHVLEASLD